jgi:aspartate racemase
LVYWQQQEHVTQGYEKKFSEQGISLYKPDAETQIKNVHNAIYGDAEQKGIKGNEFIKTASLLGDAIDSMIAKDAVNTIILGCTELPLVREGLEKRFSQITFIDPMDVIAEKAIDIFDKAVELIHKKPMVNNSDKNVLTLEKTDDYAEYIVAQVRKKL